MIAKLSGKIDCVNQDSIIIDIGGVGYLVFCSTRTLINCTAGEFASFHIISIIREDAFNLFGFLNSVDKQWFTVLTSVQGVGAKVGLCIQSALSSSDLLNAVMSEDKNAFCRASGVGAKLASRITLELKDKVAKMDFLSTNLNASSSTVSSEASSASDTAGDISSINGEAISALVNLGFDKSSAFSAVGVVVSRGGPKLILGDIIAGALKHLKNL